MEMGVKFHLAALTLELLLVAAFLMAGSGYFFLELSSFQAASLDLESVLFALDLAAEAVSGLRQRPVTVCDTRQLLFSIDSASSIGVVVLDNAAPRVTRVLVPKEACLFDSVARFFAGERAEGDQASLAAEAEAPRNRVVMPCFLGNSKNCDFSTTSSGFLTFLLT